MDNGRAGCSAEGNCPRLWASPYFNSTREGSYQILEELGAVASSKGEQKISPFPHMTISYETPGKHYEQVSIPASDWYVGTEIPGAIEWGHTTDSMKAAVDFYYNLGAMINLYGHIASNDGTLLGEYVKYCVTKPRIWSTNSVGISDWWKVRSNAVVTPSYSVIGTTASAQATITGATDPDTAIEVAIPNGNVSNLLQVLINDVAADPADYRTVGNAIRVRVGASPSTVKVQYTVNNNNYSNETWTQTDWAGGAGQSLWADARRYDSATGIDTSVAGQISLVSTSSVLFTDDFSRTDLLPWVSPLGTWTITGEVLQGSGAPNQYSYAYYSTTPQWTDYMVQGRIQLPAGSFGGGIGGRVDPATGAHYGAWVYPAGSGGGSNMLKLWKFRGWTDVGSGVPMHQVSLPEVGTGWHTLQMTFIGNRILVYYDGSLKIDMTDNNYDYQAPYVSGGISADWWTGSPLPYTIAVDNISVKTLPVYGSSGVLSSSAFDGGDGVQWQTISWDAAAGGSTNVCVRTRTADAADQLATASWSDCYSTSGSGITSANSRWIQYQLELTTSDPSVSPDLNEIRIGYLAPATTTIPDTTTTSTVEPTTSIPVPSCAGVAPASADQGATLDVTITGLNTNFFNSNTVASFSGTGITVISTVVTSPTRAVATITIDPGATLEARDVTATTGTEMVTCPAALTITAAQVTTTTTVPATTILPTTTTTLGQTWTQSDWAGGAGQSLWADATRYDSATGIDTSVAGQISLASTSSELFTDYFSRTDLEPWLIESGTWTITGEVLQGSGCREPVFLCVLRRPRGPTTRCRGASRSLPGRSEEALAGV